MGEKVQAGPLIYTVIEADWRPEIEGGRAPQNRFLFVRLTMTNSSGSTIAVPAFTLLGPNGQVYQEVSEGVGNVTNWLGLLRNVEPAQTEQGWVIFDAPMGAYKLVAADAGEVGSEKYAHIDIPVHLE